MNKEKPVYQNTLCFLSKRHLRVGLAAALTVFAFGAQADRGKDIQISIQPQETNSALLELAKNAGVQIMFSPEITEHSMSPLVQGTMTISQAMDRLLSGTGLVYEFKDDNVIVVNASAGNSGVSDKSDNRTIEEMVVTAQKRAQSINDVSMSVSAIGKDEMANRGLVGMDDYLATLPGISAMDQGPGRTSIVMRGISANPQSEGVEGALSGVYFGETPISGFGIHGNSADVKLVDMERIEVLRGPQGTLYGSSTVGGTVRNIPVVPDLNDFGGAAKLGYSDTGGFGSDNSKIEGVVNIPVIEDVLAVRLVAYHHETSGFYKNIAADDPVMQPAVAAFGAVLVNEDDIGATDYTGFRATVLWQPSDELSVKVMHLSQDSEQKGWGQSDLSNGFFLQSRQQMRVNTSEPFGEPDSGEGVDDDLSISNLTIEYDFGWATLLSSSSLLSEDYIYNREISVSFGPSRIPWSQPTNGQAESFAQEIRLASQLDGPFQYLVGYFYEDSERYFENWGLHGGDVALNPFEVGAVINLNGPHRLRNLTQHAIFGEVSYDLAEQLTVTLGARMYDYEQVYSETAKASPVFFATDSFIQSVSSEKDTNFKAGLDYTPNDNTLIYGLWSEGFRLGRPVPADPLALTCDLDNDGYYDGSNNVSTGPRTIESDNVENFEIGGKFTLFDSRLQVNAAVYRMNWEGIPVLALFNSGCAATLNAGEAMSQGAEVETNYYVSDNFLVNIGASYVQAELTADAPDLGGVSGDRLPGSPEYNFSLGLQYEFLLAGHEAFVRSDYAYVGGFYNDLKQTGTEVGDYKKLNLRGGVAIDNFNIDLFINNVTDEDNLTWIDKEFDFLGERGYHLRPRTIGFDIGYKF